MNNDNAQRLIGFYTSKKRMPSYTEMMELFGFKSKNAVYRLVQKFLDAGVVAKDAMGHLIPAQSFNELPLLGSVKAGFPSATEEAIDERMDIAEFLLPKRDSMYMVTVDGDSMIDAHIEDGDIVIAERSTTARDGQIVIANIDGEFTMKYFKQKGAKVWLEAANARFKPMHPEYNLDVVAIIKGVVRKY